MGRPSGRITACRFPPWWRALPENHRSMDLPLMLVVGAPSRLPVTIVPSRMT
jgi:hypothetical protein